MSSREKDLPTKQEGNPNQNKITKVSSSSRPWSGLNNPRIVRVSRSFGGKDRHSKVCTIKGLRDRRVRLSVPTAIQLYDLQDRLGLNQPSKVVDWLLNVAKHDIDKLPPLTMPLGFFGQYPQSMVVSHEVSAPQSSLFDGAHSLLFSRGGIKINNNVDGEDQTTMPKSNCRNFDSRDKCKEVVRETSLEKRHWIKRNEEDLVGIEGHRGQSSAPNSFLKANNSSLPSFFNNIIPYNSHYHWEPSDLSLSHLGSQGYDSYHTEDPNCYNVVSLSSSLPPSSGSQLLVCPSGTTPSFLPPYVTAPMDFDPRQTNHFQMLSSSTQHLLPNSLTPSIYSFSPPMRPLPLSITHKFLHSQNNRENQSNKENGGLLSTPTASFFQNDPKPTL